jgi:hypothetical protein
MYERFVDEVFDELAEDYDAGYDEDLFADLSFEEEGFDEFLEEVIDGALDEAIRRSPIAGEQLDPLVSSTCAQANSFSNSLRGGAQIKRRVEQWMHRVIYSDLLPHLNRLSRRELDILIGCFYGLEAALGRTSGSLRTLRGAIARQLGI